MLSVYASVNLVWSDRRILVMARHIKVLILTKHDLLGASSRMRFFQYIPWLSRTGLEVKVLPMIPASQLASRYLKGTYGLREMVIVYLRRVWAMLRLRQFDVVWIEKEALPWFPLWFELALLRGTRYVLDYDDAVYLNYSSHRNAWVRGIYGERLAKLMANASLVVGGNANLVRYALSAGAPKVAVVPTVVDLQRYPFVLHPRRTADRPARVVWIGSPSTTQYLHLLRAPLMAVARVRHIVFVVIGAGEFVMPGVPVQVFDWTQETEFKNISNCDVGVMPLQSTPWEDGKCGYKLIQYMACGLPVVASSVGVNKEIVEHGVSGFLANSAEDWSAALLQLLTDPLLAVRMGQAGRQKVEQFYNLQVTAPKVAELLTTVARGST